jgi:hypothetical protein
MLASCARKAPRAHASNEQVRAKMSDCGGCAAVRGHGHGHGQVQVRIGHGRVQACPPGNANAAAQSPARLDRALRRGATRAAMVRLPPRHRGAPGNDLAPPGVIMRPAPLGAIRRLARNQAVIPAPKCEAQIGGEIARAIPWGAAPAGVRGRAGPGQTGSLLRTSRVGPHPHQQCLPQPGPPRDGAATPHTIRRWCCRPSRRTRSVAGVRLSPGSAEMCKGELSRRFMAIVK